MTSDQINELRDTFSTALLDWGVQVSVKIEDDAANVSFELWSTKFEASLFLHDGRWTNDYDCPHFVEDSESVWQWIAMHLHDKLTA
jgi:hypothetical protein